MDFLSGLNRNLDYPERLKSELPIGLFVSFGRTHLEALKRHLREREGFNARVSYDLKTSHPRLPGEDSRAYDFRLAKALIEESRVRIIHFFREEEDEYGINDSATLEIGILYGLSVASRKRAATPSSSARRATMSGTSEVCDAAYGRSPRRSGGGTISWTGTKQFCTRRSSATIACWTTLSRRERETGSQTSGMCSIAREFFPGSSSSSGNRSSSPSSRRAGRAATHVFLAITEGGRL